MANGGLEISIFPTTKETEHDNYFYRATTKATNTYSVYFSGPCAACMKAANWVNAASISDELGNNLIALDKQILPNSMVGAGIADD